MATKGRDPGPKPTRGSDPITRLPGELTLGQIFVASGYGHNTREPFVEVEFPGHALIQLSATEARMVATLLTEAAESAEQDGAITEWVNQEWGDDTPDQRAHMAAQLLSQIRIFRAKHREKAKTKSA